MARNIKKVREMDFESRDEMMQAIASLVQRGTPFVWVPKRKRTTKEGLNQRTERVVAVMHFLQGIDELVTHEWQGKAEMLIEHIMQDEDVQEFIAPKRQRGKKHSDGNTLFSEERVMQIVAKMQSKGVYKDKQKVSDRAYAKALRMHQFNCYDESADNLHKGMGHGKRVAPMPSEVELTIEFVINESAASLQQIKHRTSKT